MGTEIKKAQMAKGRVHVLGVQRRGSRMLTAKKEVRTPNDLKGLKLRLPEIPDWVAVWKELGALPTVVAWPEVFGALQTGVVDGQENPLYLIYTTKLYEVQSHVMLTAHVHACFHWLMSDKVLSSLPTDLKDIVLKSAAEAAKYGDQLTKEQEEDFKKKLADAKMKVVSSGHQALHGQGPAGCRKNPPEVGAGGLRGSQQADRREIRLPANGSFRSHGPPLLPSCSPKDGRGGHSRFLAGIGLGVKHGKWWFQNCGPRRSSDTA